MFQTLTCIALRTIKYDDRRNIVAVWTDGCGRLSLLVPAGASREARRRRAAMMPLCIFACEADMRPGRELVSVRDVRPAMVLPDIPTRPHKTVIALFVAEVLERLLRQTQPDRALTAFLTESIVALDRAPDGPAVANFLPVFLYRLTTFTGIAPDTSTQGRGRFFDMRSACFRAAPPMHPQALGPAEARYISLLEAMDYGNAARVRLPAPVRRLMLNRLLEYYTLHITPLDSLHSLDVVREL